LLVRGHITGHLAGQRAVVRRSAQHRAAKQGADDDGCDQAAFGQAAALLVDLWMGVGFARRVHVAAPVMITNYLSNLYAEK
jgi:hypothetical protein